MSTVLVCDACGEKIARDGTGELERVGVSVNLGWSESSADWTDRDYHRLCARSMSIAAVWAASGRVPL